jgi:hypothetical protein
MFTHFLAEKLGRTVAELEEGLSVDEYMRWAAYYRIQADERKKALDQAKHQAKAKKR